MSAITLIATAFVSLMVVALAQPAVNAPLLPQYNYITGSGSDAVVSAVVVGDYAFTADTNGVWGANVQGSFNDVAPFWDALPGVTQLWSWCANVSDASTCAVHAIAGPAVALYRMNDTAIWRAAIFQATNATFDVISDSRSPSYMYPVVLPNAAGTSAFFVLGTRNTSSVASAALPSTVYAFDVWDLSVTWSTVVNSDTTSFSTANCTDFVWILTQNQTFGYSDIVVRKLYPNNGAILDWSFDSSVSSSNTNIGVANGQFMVLGGGGYLTLAFYNGTVIALDYSIPTSCYTMPFTPTLIGATWYAICGSYVVMYDFETGARKPSFITGSSNSIRCCAIHQADGDFVLSGSDVVYVGSASGISQLVDLPNSIGGGGSSTCTGARFNWVSRTDIVHLSYTGYYSGSVLALNYRTGEVVYQAAVDVTPVGPAVVDWTDQRLFVSSTSGNVLQGYELVPMNGNTMSFVSDLSGATGSSTTFSVAYNATNRSTYYISTYNLYTVDWTGASEQLATFGYVSSWLAPLQVGQYLVFCDSYYDKVYVYDSLKKALTTLSVDDVDIYVQPYVFGMTVVVFGTDYSTAAAVIDLSAATIAAVPITADSYRQVSGAALVGTTLVINTGTSFVTGYDTTQGTYSATLFVLNQAKNSLYLVLSAPVAFLSRAYFIARTYSLTLPIDYNNAVFSVTASGHVCKVGTLLTQTSTGQKVLSIKSGGVFGGAVLYIIGSQNVTAYTTSWKMLFNYVSSETIIITPLPLTPTVLDTGAICFYTTYAFTVVGGFEGGLAWYYNTSSTVYPALTDRTTIFFSDGQYVIGADTYSGAVTSLSTYGRSTLRGFTIAAGPSSTTIVGATDDQLVFSLAVARQSSAPAQFPGADSFHSRGSFCRSDITPSNTKSKLQASRSAELPPTVSDARLSTSASSSQTHSSVTARWFPDGPSDSSSGSLRFALHTTCGVGAILMAAAAIPHGGFGVRRLGTLAALGDCGDETSRWASSLYDMAPPLDAPLQLQIGGSDSAISIHRGTVVGNIVLLVAIIPIASLLVIMIHSRTFPPPSRSIKGFEGNTRWTTLINSSAADLRLPGILILFLVLLLGPLVASSTWLIVSDTSDGGDAALGVVGLLFSAMLVAPCAHVLRPTTAQFHLTAADSVKGSLMAGNVWEFASAADRRLVAHFGHLFQRCRDGCHSWLLAEIAVTVIVSALSGIATAKPSTSTCRGLAWIAFFACCVATIAFIAARPMNSSVHMLASLVCLVGQIVVVACSAGGASGAADVIGMLAAVPMIVFALATIASWVAQSCRGGDAEKQQLGEGDSSQQEQLLEGLLPEPELLELNLQQHEGKVHIAKISNESVIPTEGVPHDLI